MMHWSSISKQVKELKVRDPYARRKNLLQDTDKVMKGIEVEEHDTPTEMLIKPLSRKDKLMIGVRLFVAIVGLIAVALSVLAVISTIMR